jgi:hypothetical protein
MNLENEWVMLDAAQKISIAELKAKNKALTIELEDAGIEIAKLKLEIVKLEDGQLALNIKLEDANNEIGRLSMLLKE